MKKELIKTLGGEEIVRIFVDKYNDLNIFTKNPIKEVKENKIGDLPKETIYFGERDGLCSCRRRPKDPHKTIFFNERFFNEILHNKDQIMLVYVNNDLQAVKLLKVLELLPDGWHIKECINDTEHKYYISKQKDNIFEFYLKYIIGEEL